MEEIVKHNIEVVEISEESKDVAADNTPFANRAIFVLLAVMLIISVIAYGGVDVWMIGLNSILAGLIIIFWLVDSWKTNLLRFNSSWLQIPIVGMILIGIIQLLPFRNYTELNDVLSISAADSLSLNPYLTRLFVIQLIIGLVFFAAALTYISNRRRFQSIVLTILIFGSIIAFYGILQYLTNPESVYGLRPIGQSSPFASFFNKHHFAAFMEITLGLTLGLLFGDATKKNKKIFLIIAAVIMGMALFLSGSRGGMISFLGVLGFVIFMNFLVNRKIKNKNASEELKNYIVRRNLILFGGGFALVLILFLSVIFIGGDQSLIRGLGLSVSDDDITSGRSHFWLIALQIFADYPILGSGFDSYGVAFTRYDTWSGAYRVEQAHNDYLQILADAGIFGFACIMAFIVLLFRQGMRSIKDDSDKFVFNGVIGAMAGCFGILIHSFFDFPLRTPSNALYFLMLAALITVPINFRRLHRKKLNINN